MHIKPVLIVATAAMWASTAQATLLPLDLDTLEAELHAMETAKQLQLATDENTSCTSTSSLALARMPPGKSHNGLICHTPFKRPTFNTSFNLTTDTLGLEWQAIEWNTSERNHVPLLYGGRHEGLSLRSASDAVSSQLSPASAREPSTLSLLAPSTLSLLAMGIGGIVYVSRRQRRRA